MRQFLRYVAFVRPQGSAYCSSTLREDVTFREVARRRCKNVFDRRLSAGAVNDLVQDLVAQFPAVSAVVLLNDELPTGKSLQPEILSHNPVPCFTLSRSIALASAMPEDFCRFVLIDFRSPGSVSLVKRGAGNAIEDFRTHVMSLGGMLGMPELMNNKWDDILAIVPRHDVLAKVLARLLRVTDDFGYTSLGLFSSLFGQPGCADAILRALAPEGGSTRSAAALCYEDALFRGAARALSRLDLTAGVLSVRSDDSVVYSMNAPLTVSYSITQLRKHIFDVHEPALSTLAGGRPVLIAIDETVDDIYGRDLRRYADLNLNAVDILRIRGGETNKSFEQVAAVCDAAVAMHLPRNGAMIGIGGGVALDIVGLACTLFRRGIGFIRVPTTLLAMIDVAVGIKHGINFAGKKNILGTFYPPLGAINDPAFLKTVSPRDLACGIAEAVKIALVADAELFLLIERHADALLKTNFQNPGPAVREFLERSQIAMMAQLAPNLYETDLKRAVDFGHSFSPAIEAASAYSIPHGEAVAIDMLIATAIAVHRKICPSSLFERLLRVYEIAGLPLTCDFITPPFLENALREVRHHRGGRLNFPVPTGIGTYAFLQKIDAKECVLALDAVSGAAGALCRSG